MVESKKRWYAKRKMVITLLSGTFIVVLGIIIAVIVVAVTTN